MRAAGKTTPTVMRLRIALLSVKPAPWRRIEVSASTSLAGLHDAIQAAYGMGGPASALFPHPRPAV